MYSLKTGEFRRFAVMIRVTIRFSGKTSRLHEIPNLFPHSEPGEISFTNLSCPTV